MKIRVISVALLATVIAAGTAQAKSIRTVGAPVNTPPSSFAGSQFVDNAGCVYVRGGIGGNVTWVPRVTRDRKPVCGQTPTFRAATAVETAPTPAPVVIVPAPARSTTSGTSRQRTAAQPATTSTVKRVVPQSTGPKVYAMPKPPAGFKYAFEDGRLNPNRGERTATGRAAMNRIWTQEVPRRLVDPKSPVHVAVMPNSYRVSTKSRSAAKAQKQDAAGQIYVQVGSYARSANAKTAATQVHRLGFPVRAMNVKRGGETLQIVLAGPFESEAESHRALRKARKSGFDDAFLRK
ncbi:sporulation related protein [Aliiruegeria haliotis]|uniref:Sporulation related protein n=1 Tax=Aliiruegeria haliotis TaxID=1280846 RepID=A0A2T0RJ92_9RHOB|nr:SPOR domain-containing protein [Aliiruegeria haliotis]PRY21187.1 sporulation related protein [Aliiruegeria haliotis]